MMHLKPYHISVVSKYLLFCIISFLIIGCAPKQELIKANIKELLPQTEELQDQNRLKSDFLKRYFSPWDGFTYTLKDATWAFEIYHKSKNIYLSNKLPATQEFWHKIKHNMNTPAFLSLNKKAIAIKPSYIKNLPTDEPLFRDFQKAGEGYPFDYNQNSYTKINEPLIVSHLCFDKEWALVHNHFTVGWVKTETLEFVENESMRYQDFVVNTADDLPLYLDDGSFYARAKLGTLFPLVKIKNDGYIIKAGKQTLLLNTSDASLFPLSFEKDNIHKIFNELYGEEYGWGGYLYKRDCSLMSKDFFATFGIWLPRNSKAQSLSYPSIDISKLSPQEKKEMIIQKAKPFRSLIYLPGHIMIYAGSKEQTPFVFHNTWGVKTKNFQGESRHIVAKAILSSIDFGKDVQNHIQKDLILYKAKEIVQLP